MLSPAVSVIMVVRDGQQWLRHAIESILDQTFSSLELLVIDDGSSDNTPYILADYRARDPRVIVISQAQRGIGFRPEPRFSTRQCAARCTPGRRRCCATPAAPAPDQLLGGTPGDEFAGHLGAGY